MDISRLKGYITHFSEEIRLNAKHGDQVKVAGMITDVFRISENYYSIVIDDHLGTLKLICTKNFFDHFKSILKHGNYVVFEGYVNILTRFKGGDTERQYSVAVYFASLIEEGDGSYA